MTALKEAREARGWTRAELADRAALNVIRLGEYETGKVTPSRSVLEHLAATLGVYLEDITPPTFKTNTIDDACMCHHEEDRHLKGIGACTWTAGAATCACRRFRRYADIRAQRREEKFWAGVGRHE